MPGHDGGMEVTVRPAELDDAADDLLYLSAQRYYDAYAGGEQAARRILRRVHRKPGHAASVSLCRVAVAGGRVVGVIVGFPADDAEALARRFLTLTAPRVPPWRWPRLLRHLNAVSGMSPTPAAGSWYVDALAVAEDARRRGVARALLADAEASARGAGRDGRLARHRAREHPRPPPLRGRRLRAAGHPPRARRAGRARDRRRGLRRVLQAGLASARARSARTRRSSLPVIDRGTWSTTSISASRL